VIFPSGGQVYNGTGFINSGVMLPTDPNAKPQPYKLTFTRPGTYEFDCLLHPGMDGTITVLP
jgi:plastocyanin